jgi:hypothetical protein
VKTYFAGTEHPSKAEPWTNLTPWLKDASAHITCTVFVRRGIQASSFSDRSSGGTHHCMPSVEPFFNAGLLPMLLDEHPPFGVMPLMPQALPAEAPPSAASAVVSAPAAAIQKAAGPMQPATSLLSSLATTPASTSSTAIPVAPTTTLAAFASCLAAAGSSTQPPTAVVAGASVSGTPPPGRGPLVPNVMSPAPGSTVSSASRPGATPHPCVAQPGPFATIGSSTKPMVANGVPAPCHSAATGAQIPVAPLPPPTGTANEAASIGACIAELGSGPVDARSHGGGKAPGTVASCR